jgi:hypothetical protein
MLLDYGHKKVDFIDAWAAIQHKKDSQSAQNLYWFEISYQTYTSD